MFLKTFSLFLASALTCSAAEPITNSVGMKLIPIPAGTFTMGSPHSEAGRGSDEDQVEVTITTPFYMADTEVTQGQWLAVTGRTLKEQIETQTGPIGRSAKLVTKVSAVGDDQPMPFVNYADALEFCAILTAKEHASGNLPETLTYTLPTEAQWEYACRAGTTTVFSSGDTLDSDDANFYGKIPYGVEGEGEYRDKTTPVKTFAPNPWGLYDVHGNLYEWCLDWYSESAPGGTDPEVIEEGDSRIIRGGTWNRKATSCRSAYRYSSTPERRAYNVGFRVALVSKSP